MAKIDEEIEVISTNLKDKETTVVTVSEYGKKMIEQAMFNFQDKSHLYTRILGADEDFMSITNTKELSGLAMNPQNDINKVKRINSIIKYYVNKDDLTGRVYEVLENNVNIQTKKNFSNVPSGRNKIKIKDNAEKIINDFDEKVDIEKFIRQSVTTTFSEGNFATYLRNTKNGYTIDIYPLGIVEVSPYDVDGEPLLLFNVDELKNRLSSSQNIFKNLKANNPFAKTVEDEIKKNYPKEVYDAYLVKDKYAVLDPARASIIRINNLNGLYGVSPIFKSLPSQLMLETIDSTDKKNTIAKGRKFIVQLLRKEMLSLQGEDMVLPFEEMAYAHTNLLEALSKDTVVVTCPPYVEKIDLVEPKQEMTDIETITYYRNKVLNSLGINYLSNEAKSSFNSVQVNVSELLKTINKITSQLEKVINKYYKLVCSLKNIDEIYCPTIKIIDSEMLDSDAKAKLVDLLYSKIGVSYKSVFELLNMDYETEVQRRIEENNYEAYGNNTGLKGLDNTVFTPHVNSYTTNSNDLMNNNQNAKTPENQNQNKDQQDNDANRYNGQV